MIEEPPLLKIKKHFRRPTETQIDAFKNVQTGFVVDAMYGAGALDKTIQPVGRGLDLDCQIYGAALTADCGPADILATLAALNYIAPGDILVSAFAAHQGCAAAGDSVTHMMKNSGARGLVTDGPVRDYAGIVEVGLPVWCTGLTPASPHSNGPGKVGFPIQIGGQTVENGDMVIADRDGVVVVPFDLINEVIENLDRVIKLEIEREKLVAAGLRIPENMLALLKSDKTRFYD